MAPQGQLYPLVAALCFAAAAAIFLLVFTHGLVWRIRGASWGERAFIASAAAALLTMFLYFGRVVLR